MTALEIVLGAVLLVVALALVVVTRDPSHPVSLLQLVTDARSGRMSLGRVGQLAALIVSSWAFVWLTIAGTLTEWYYGTYMLAWAGARIADQLVQQRGATVRDSRMVPGSEAPDAR